jgi:hypothetical protein
VTIFLGCGFAAKYLEGGGNFSVPLQWMLGLRRLRQDAIWLELLPGSKNRKIDNYKIDNFRRQMRGHGLARRYALLYQQSANDLHDLDAIECIGISKRGLRDRLAGPNTLLNLSHSIHQPLLLQFQRRIFCDLDPSEIFYWMTQMEMGQSTHHEFWTIGLNVGARDCKLPTPVVAAVPAAFTVPQAKRLVAQERKKIQWRTFYPLVDTKYFQPQPRPRADKFTTIGQWYWSGAVEVAGEFPDLSKKHAFERYVDLPRRAPDARFELAMNINADDPERSRLRKHGWHVVDPHRVARTPKLYRRYLTSALGEFTAIKGVDVAWRTGWLSDRAAAFLALGRSVITEDTGAAKYLPRQSGFAFVHDVDEATEAASRVRKDWKRWSKISRACALEVFDSAKNLRKILSL